MIEMNPMKRAQDQFERIARDKHEDMERGLRNVMSVYNPGYRKKVR